MKYRPSILIYVEVLKVLIDGPMTATRLSQVCNAHYDKMREILLNLESSSLIERTVQEKNEVYVITGAGLDVQRDWEKVRARLKLPWGSD